MRLYYQGVDELRPGAKVWDRRDVRKTPAIVHEHRGSQVLIYYPEQVRGWLPQFFVYRHPSDLTPRTRAERRRLRKLRKAEQVQP